MKIEIFENNWSVKDVKSNPDKLFLFGDNDLRWGKGGQAIIRDLINTIGIRTKKEPKNEIDSFYKDEDYLDNISKIREDVLLLKSKLMDYSTLVLSSGGYGNGLAKLKESAPKTYQFLNDMLKYYFQFDNETGKKWIKVPGYDEISAAKYVRFNKDNSDLIQPINNSFFKEEYLESGLFSNFQLIKTGKKVSFISKEKIEIGQTIILTFPDTLDTLICRVSDCFDSSISENLGLLYKFEGWSEKFKFDLEQTYQIHFQLIAVFTSNCEMIYEDGIFSNVIPKTNSEKKILGDTHKVDNSDNLKSFRKLLEKEGLSGEITLLSLNGQTRKYQVKVDDKYYAIEYKKVFFWDSLKVLLESKNPFI